MDLLGKLQRAIPVVLLSSSMGLVTASDSGSISGSDSSEFFPSSTYESDESYSYDSEEIDDGLRYLGEDNDSRARKRHRSYDDSEDMPSPKRLRTEIDLSGIPFPKQIYAELTQYTIGQDSAMKSLATFIHKHLVDIQLQELYADFPESEGKKSISKSNILLIGPTGCGKTSSLEVLAKYLNVPLVVGNATEWTAQGYVGSKWTDLFEKLYFSTLNFLSKDGKHPTEKEVQYTAEHAIVFIDEIDKLCATGQDLSVIERVQQELLPVIQGTTVTLEDNQTLDTSNILFIAGGAFPGLLTESGKNKNKLQTITPKMLEKYGMLPELAGRLGNIVQFSNLTQNDLKRIMTTSKSSFMAQYVDQYKLAYKIDLTFSDEAIDYIAEVASHHRTGARAINAMINKVMEDIIFDIGDYMNKPLCIERDVVVKALKDFEEKEQSNTSHLMMYL